MWHGRTSTAELAVHAVATGLVALSPRQVMAGDPFAPTPVIAPVASLLIHPVLSQHTLPHFVLRQRDGEAGAVVADCARVLVSFDDLE